MNTHEVVYSAATSCLLYVRQHLTHLPCSEKVSATNHLVTRWLSSAERRNLYPRAGLREIRSKLKQAKKSNNTDLLSIIHLLVEGSGQIHNLDESQLAQLQSARLALLTDGWWIKFTEPQEWHRVDLNDKPVCFGLRSDVERCFDHLGQLIEPLPLYVTGERDELSAVLERFNYRLKSETSESVEGVTVWQCLLTTGELNEC